MNSPPPPTRNSGEHHEVSNSNTEPTDNCGRNKNRTEEYDSNLEIAVLVDDGYIKKWERNALASLASEPDIEITHVVINDRKTTLNHKWERVAFAQNAFEQIRALPLWSLVGIARLLTPDPEYNQPVHIDSIEWLSNAERLICTAQPVGKYWKTLPDEIVNRIENVDIAVRFGFGMIKGRILRAPKYGVLSYHPGDIRKYRGTPACFWEFLNDEDEAGVTVQLLNETLDGGEIAANEIIDISEMKTWQEIKQEAFCTAESLLVPAVRTLTEPGKNVEQPNQIGDLYFNPKGWAVLRYVFKNTHGRIQNLTSGKVPSPAHTWRRPIFLTALLLAGLLAVGTHPLFTHHYIVPIHIEQIVGLVTVALSIVLLFSNNKHQAI